MSRRCASQIPVAAPAEEEPVAVDEPPPPDPEPWAAADSSLEELPEAAELAPQIADFLPQEGPLSSLLIGGKGLEDGDELLGVKRLGHVGGAARLVTRDAIRRQALGAQQDDRHRA